MWFNNLIIFSYQTPLAKDLDDVQGQLFEYRLKPCPPHAKETIGFDSILPENQEILLQSANACHLGSLTQRQRLLPASVLKAALEEKKLSFEAEFHKQMSRSDVLQTKETLEFDLLPKAFTVDKKRWFYIDTKKQWIVINSAQANQASDIIAYLIKSLGSLNFAPIQLEHALPSLMQSWVKNPDSLAYGFKLGKQCQLVRSEDDKTTHNCKDIESHHEHLCDMFEQGFQIKSLDLIWEDKISFSLMDTFVFKRLKCLDLISEGLKENQNLESKFAQIDADLALLSGEVRLLMDDFLSLIDNQEDEEKESSSTNKLNVNTELA